MGILAKKSPDGEKRITREVVILNRYGLHARPASMFVKTSNRFKSEIWVEKDGEEVNGKSIMGLMMLAAGHGSKLKVSAAGNDAEKFLEEIEELVAKRFHEE
ncbi:MAG: HPr family phosphocarrier protein [Chthoniobacterales bacterium]|jgi:phosphocarrier protein|nr:HPr family phosphocarrier protein [Chthoniobacterales bacterium]